MASAVAANPTQGTKAAVPRAGAAEQAASRVQEQRANAAATERGNSEHGSPQLGGPELNGLDLKTLDLNSDEARWRPLFALPCQLTVDLPLSDFTVANLLELGAGSMLRTGWHVGRDVPLRVNDTLIGWSEFEAVNNRLAVRLTELA